MKMALITVIDTDKEFCDGEVFEIHGEKSSQYLRLEDVIIGFEELMKKLTNEAKEKADDEGWFIDKC